MKNNKGITLIALVITIIILIILAGVGLNLALGNNGIMNKAKFAEEEYTNAQISDEEKINDLYSQMLIATNDSSKITITVEDLNKLIEEKTRSMQPTGVKTDAYIQNTRTVTTAYSGVTSMTGFTRTTDLDNKISEYLSYSDEIGYTVLKSGWYFVYMGVSLKHTTSVDATVSFYINEEAISHCTGWASGGFVDKNSDSFPIYLKEGDEIYFMASGTNNATVREITCTCRPMF